MIDTILGSMPPDPGWEKPLLNPSTGTSWMYPICIMLGFVVAIVLGCLKLWKRYKVSTEPFYWFILIGVPCAIFGARFGSCAIGQTPWGEFFVNFGTGLAIEWGVMLTVLAAFIYFPLILKLPRYRVKDVFGPVGDQKVKKVSMWLYFDAIVPAILIAQFIGRWGNYCNQEVYGKAVTSEGLANFLNTCLPGMYIDGEWKQPLFFWEGIGNLLMFFALYFGLEFVKQRKTGDLAGAYFVWYGIFRAALEPLRDNKFGFQVSIVTSIIWAIVGVLFIVINHLVISKVRNEKIWHTIWEFGPIEPIRMLKIEWNKFIINYKSNKLHSFERQKSWLVQSVSNNNQIQKTTNDEAAQQLDNKIELYKKSINEIQQKLDKYLSDRKQIRAKHVADSYNDNLKKLKQKYESIRLESEKQLATISDANLLSQKRSQYDLKLKEVNNQIMDLQKESIEAKQEKYEKRHEGCIRKEQELIYYGAW